MRTQPKAWTEEEKQQLRTLLQTRHTRPEVCKQLGRGPNDVRSMIGELRRADVIAAAAPAAAGLDEDENEVEEELPPATKGRQGEDQKYGDSAIRAASDGFSAAIGAMTRRRHGHAQ